MNKLLIALLPLLLFNACVSKKKWMEEQQNRLAAENRTGMTQKSLDSANQSILDLQLKLADKTGESRATAEAHSKALLVIGEKEKEIGRLSNEILNKQEQASTLLKRKLLESAKKDSLIKNIAAIYKSRDSLLQKVYNNITQAIAPFADNATGVELKEDRVVVKLGDVLLFKAAKDKVELKGKDCLGVLSKVLERYPTLEITVLGNTDNTPATAPFTDNWDLGARRAAAVVRLLTKDFGLNPGKITLVSRGEFAPVASNALPELKTYNRRTELHLQFKLGEVQEVLKKAE